MELTGFSEDDLNVIMDMDSGINDDFSIDGLIQNNLMQEVKKSSDTFEVTSSFPKKSRIL